MKSKKSKIITIVSIVLAVVVYITVSHWLSLQKSVDIDVKYLSSIDGDIKEVLYVEKFTDEESAVIALAKNSDDCINVYALWDTHIRYGYQRTYQIYSTEQFNSIEQYKIIASTKFGDLYVCIFPNPTEDTVMVNGLEHKVFKFNATIDGVEYYLGFYCGLKNTSEDTGNGSVS